MLIVQLPVFAMEPVKYVRKIFQVDPVSEFYLNCKYGHIELQQWDGDSIVVEATFSVMNKEMWEVEGLKEKMDFKCESWKGMVRMETSIDSVEERTNEIVVDMVVKVPEFVTLNIVNRYGYIHLPSFYAYRNTILSMIYGDIVVDHIGSSDDVTVRLNVSYGKLTVADCYSANIKSAYSSVGVKKARFLDIRAEKSRIYIGDVDSLVSRGKYNIYEVEN